MKGWERNLLVGKEGLSAHDLLDQKEEDPGIRGKTKGLEPAWGEFTGSMAVRWRTGK